MNTATLIRSLIDANEELEETSDLSTIKPTNFGNVQFGAQHKAWSFTEIEELASSDPLYRNFQKNLTEFLGASNFESPKDQDRVLIYYVCFLIFGLIAILSDY